MNVALVKLPDKVSVALMVIAGEYGIGQERKQKLIEDGYDAAEIQKCVNELLRVMEKYG